MKIELTARVKKQIKKLPNTELKKIAKKLDLIKCEPYTGKKLEGKLEYQYSLKAWPYRIIYKINSNNKTIYIVAIQHRQGVYK